ncbi:hypothetical protein BDR03DRAFT_956891 [Suillus americanus]|nr:hypothetical protein BDR03DRAFT_956891 [Suillus americanus]
MIHSMFGTEVLAVIYSMPYAFLQWGIIFFVLAFAFLVFQHSDFGLMPLFVICVVWDTRTAWWLYPISIRRCTTASLAKFCMGRLCDLLWKKVH